MIVEKMSEASRHSVDAPLSRTLVALRRVRSLRDPSTNSISKFSAFVDNMSWEANSCKGVYLGLENECDGDSSDHHSLLGSQNFHLDDSDPESDYSSRKADAKVSSFKKSSRVGNGNIDSIRSTKCVDRSSFSRLNFDGLYEDRLSNGRNRSDHRKKTVDSTWTPHSSQLTEDLNSNNKLKMESSYLERIDTTLLARKSRYSKLMKSSGIGKDAVGSHIGSASPSTTDPWINGSSTSTSNFVNEEVDVVGSNHHGCGISCCWSMTPKFRDPNILSDVEDRLLSSANGREITHSGKKRRSEYFKRELRLYSDSPRSLSQKFRPRSFNELVGQHVVSQSLLNAILKEKVSPLYLFHGPRGTGKTSTSRIFAAALNCLSVEEHRPCGFCRECVLFFSGRVRDVKEIDASKMNHIGRVKSLLRHAAHAPISSHYKVFIIDECQLLRGETWAAFLNSLEELPRYVVFVMITADPNKLPHSAMSRCQRYHFPKIRDADIVQRLQSLCTEEDLDFEDEALHFVAAKSNGSLRDAETMLDQLSLLGKRITISRAYELIGTVSDDELLDLLDLALSSDTSNTVRRARELMKSRIDPMQLTSQLANLIMDILAGRWHSRSSAVGRKFCDKHTLADVDLQKLRHALKILSETEKQLRTSKNQTTWLTVALLQLSSRESTSLDGNDSNACLKLAHRRDDGSFSTSSPKEGLSHSVSLCNHNGSHESGIKDKSSGKLEAIWSRTVEKCQSNALKRFLQKEGKLTSVFVSQGLAIAEVEFHHPNHVSKAEKQWKHIASSLQLVLGQNVEIRINLGPCTDRKNAKVKKSIFNLLNCSHSLQEDLHSGNSSSPSSAHARQETPANMLSSCHLCHFSPLLQQEDGKHDPNAICIHRKDAVTIRNFDGNALSTGTTTTHETVEEHLPDGCGLELDSSKAVENHNCQYLGTHEPETQPKCFSKTLKLKRMLLSPNVACTICLRIQPNDKVELSIPKKSSIETYFCTDDPYIFCSHSSEEITYSDPSGDKDGSIKDSKVSSKLHCWRTTRFKMKQILQHRRHGQRRSQLVRWILPCSTAKKFRAMN